MGTVGSSQSPDIMIIETPESSTSTGSSSCPTEEPVPEGSVRIKTNRIMTEEYMQKCLWNQNNGAIINKNVGIGLVFMAGVMIAIIITIIADRYYKYRPDAIVYDKPMVCGIVFCFLSFTAFLTTGSIFLYRGMNNVTNVDKC